MSDWTIFVLKTNQSNTSTLWILPAWVMFHYTLMKVGILTQSQFFRTNCLFSSALATFETLVIQCVLHGKHIEVDGIYFTSHLECCFSWCFDVSPHRHIEFFEKNCLPDSLGLLSLAVTMLKGTKIYRYLLAHRYGGGGVAIVFMLLLSHGRKPKSKRDQQRQKSTSYEINPTRPNHLQKIPF